MSPWATTASSRRSRACGARSARNPMGRRTSRRWRGAGIALPRPSANRLRERTTRHLMRCWRHTAHSSRAVPTWSRLAISPSSMRARCSSGSSSRRGTTRRRTSVWPTPSRSDSRRRAPIDRPTPTLCSRRFITRARRVGSIRLSAEAWATLGLVLLQAGESTDAIAAARRAVSLDADNWRHHLRHAYVSWGEERLRRRASDARIAATATVSRTGSRRQCMWRGRRSTQPNASLRAAPRRRSAQGTGDTRFGAVGLFWLQGLVRLARGDEADGARGIGAGTRCSSHQGISTRARVAQTPGMRWAPCRLTHGDVPGAHEAFDETLHRVPGHLFATRRPDDAGRRVRCVAARWRRHECRPQHAAPASMPRSLVRSTPRCTATIIGAAEITAEALAAGAARIRRMDAARGTAPRRRRAPGDLGAHYSRGCEIGLPEDHFAPRGLKAPRSYRSRGFRLQAEDRLRGQPEHIARVSGVGSWKLGVEFRASASACARRGRAGTASARP